MCSTLRAANTMAAVCCGPGKRLVWASHASCGYGRSPQQSCQAISFSTFHGPRKSCWLLPLTPLTDQCTWWQGNRHRSSLLARAVSAEQDTALAQAQQPSSSSWHALPATAPQVGRERRLIGQLEDHGWDACSLSHQCLSRVSATHSIVGITLTL